MRQERVGASPLSNEDVKRPEAGPTSSAQAPRLRASGCEPSKAQNCRLNVSPNDIGSDDSDDGCENPREGLLFGRKTLHRHAAGKATCYAARNEQCHEGPVDETGERIVAGGRSSFQLATVAYGEVPKLNDSQVGAA